MQSESGMVRARGRKVQTENHFRAAEPNRRKHWNSSGVLAGRLLTESA